MPKIPYCCLPYESGPCLSSSVAGHPLRSAMHHYLGGLFSHQLANAPQAHPLAIPCSIFLLDKMPCPLYAVLAAVSYSYPPLKARLPTCYSPVRYYSLPEGNKPFNLHVLGTPPAFILSQDQTLLFFISSSFFRGFFFFSFFPVLLELTFCSV